MSALELWGGVTTANAQKVLWLLRELDCPFAYRGERYEPEGPVAAAYLLARGENDVASPVLRIDGVHVLWEANAVLRYLATVCRAEALYPSEPFARAVVERWMDYQLSTIRTPLHRLLRDDLEPSAVARSAEHLNRTLEPVEAALRATPYLAGDAFTLADIPVAINVYRWELVDIGRRPFPAIAAWMRRIRARPAFAASILPPREPQVPLTL